jgi:hypothetical protein
MAGAATAAVALVVVAAMAATVVAAGTPMGLGSQRNTRIPRPMPPGRECMKPSRKGIETEHSTHCAICSGRLRRFHEEKALLAPPGTGAAPSELTGIGSAGESTSIKSPLAISVNPFAPGAVIPIDESAGGLDQTVQVLGGNK